MSQLERARASSASGASLPRPLQAVSASERLTLRKQLDRGIDWIAPRPRQISRGKQRQKAPCRTTQSSWSLGSPSSWTNGSPEKGVAPNFPTPPCLSWAGPLLCALFGLRPLYPYQVSSRRSLSKGSAARRFEKFPQKGSSTAQRIYFKPC